jgi:hypothetical protein
MAQTALNGSQKIEDFYMLQINIIRLERSTQNIRIYHFANHGGEDLWQILVKVFKFEIIILDFCDKSLFCVNYSYFRVKVVIY